MKIWNTILFTMGLLIGCKIMHEVQVVSPAYVQVAPAYIVDHGKTICYVKRI